MITTNTMRTTNALQQTVLLMLHNGQTEQRAGEMIVRIPVVYPPYIECRW